MKFLKYFALIAILILCLTASTEAGFRKAIKKVGHQVEHAGQNVANAVHKAGNAAEDVGKVAAAGAIVGALVP